MSPPRRAQREPASRHDVGRGRRAFRETGRRSPAAVEAAMRFLIDREPKEAILSAFDIRVIRRYFTEFDDAFPGYLARLGGAPRNGS
jgi:hypothetical protein